MARQNTELLAIFCNRPSGNLHPPLIESGDDFLIAEWISGNLLFDHLPNSLLHHLITDGRAIRILKSRGEKIS